MLTAILIASSVVLLVLGFVVYYSNPKSVTNISLAAFILAGLIWVVTNLLANLAAATESPHALLYARLTIVGASLLPITYLFFVRAFVKHTQRLSLLEKLLYVVPLVFLLSSTFTNLNLTQSGQEISIGPAYYIIIPYFLACFTQGTAMLVRAYRASEGVKRVQLQYIFLGIILSVIPGLILNAVLPLFGYINTAYFGPSVVIFFALFTSLAIVKHQLLNVRLVIARSVAYVFSIGLLFIAYVSASSLVLNVLLDSNRTGVAVNIFNVLALAAAVLFYQPQKRFFDKITNKVFYRDAYDPQVFLDQLNKTIINNIELGILLRHAAQVIENNLKCEYAQFSVFEGNKTGARALGSKKKVLDAHEISHVRQLAASSEKVIDTDSIEAEHPKLHNLLAENDVAVLAQLVSPVGGGKESTAYMLLGPKKSGNQYSSQDLQIIEIISDELVVAIQNALRFEEIQNFNVTLQEKVNDATRKLRETNKKLKEMDETKDDFISMASHQLRTPLTSVKGYLSMVLEGDAGKVTASQQKMLEQAFVSSQRMTYLISDLLNVSRLKTGKFVIERTRMNLVEMVQQEIAQLTEAAKGRNLTLLFDPPKEFPDLMLDETKTRQIVMNFVDNAIYYTPPGGTIEIKVADKPESVELTVVDNGFGVPKRDRPHLFTKFYRANNARKARPDGTGLGLFMAKKVVVAQGGAIIFTSQEGKGSTFGFTFPKTKELLKI